MKKMNLAAHLAFVMVIPKSAPEIRAMAEVVILENAYVHIYILRKKYYIITEFAMSIREILLLLQLPYEVTFHEMTRVGNIVMESKSALMTACRLHLMVQTKI